jgi:hypothetical protein
MLEPINDARSNKKFTERTTTSVSFNLFLLAEKI